MYIKPIEPDRERRIKKGHCYATKWCPECDNRLYESQVFYNNGVCPYCGKYDNSTVCAYITKVFRQVKHQKLLFGFFWKTVTVENELVKTYSRR